MEANPEATHGPLPSPRRSDDRIEIYVYRDSRGLPLYVGITGRPPQREAEHMYRSKWIRYKAGKETLEYAESMEDAAAREAYLIRRLKPVFNIQQQAIDWRARRKAYLTLYDPDVLDTEDGAAMLLDPEAAQLAPDGAVGKATAFVMAKWNGDDRARAMLLWAAGIQDRSGEHHCVFASSWEMARAHGGDRFEYGRSHEVARDSGWISSRLTRGTSIPSDMYADDQGMQRVAFRVPEDDFELAKNVDAIPKRGRRR